jgi:hypothetical protein
MSDQDARRAQLAAERGTTTDDLADHERGCIGCDVCREIDPELECLQAGDDCAGPVELRMSLSETGIPHPRCDHHWSKRLDLEAELNERYPVHPPSDWSPLDAGEAWSEEDY